MNVLIMQVTALDRQTMAEMGGWVGGLGSKSYAPGQWKGKKV